MKQSFTWLAIFLVTYVANSSAAATINIALDVDSTRTSGGPGNQPITTQTDFDSWDLSTFTANGAGSSITVDGVTFQAFGTNNNATRSRAIGGGGAFDSLTKEFLYKDGAGGGVGIRITGLEAGRYAMQSWHYDSDSSIVNQQNAIRVDVREFSGSPDTDTRLSNYLFHPTDPASFTFDVAFDNQVRELIFFEDSEFDHARLNGFILTSLVPEPASLLTACFGVAAALMLRRRR